MKNISNIQFFDSDDDFYMFCVVPKLDVHKCINNNGDEVFYTDFELSNVYNDAIANGKEFMIKNPDSLIQKRGFVSYRGHTKKVDNLFPYKRSYERVINECNCK